MFLKIIEEGGKDLLRKGKETIDKLRPRVDDKMPLGIKIGDVIDFSSLLIHATFLEGKYHFDDGNPGTDHSYLELHCKLPDSRKEVVTFNKEERDGFIICSFYFKDNHFLEITCSIAKPTEPIENGIRYYSFGEEIIPEGNDVELYLPNRDRSNTWWIGNRSYPLPGQNVDAEGVWAQFAYQRMWGISEDRIPPKRVIGYVYTDPYTKEGQRIVNNCMLYARTPVHYVLNDVAEVPMEECEYFYIQAIQDDSGLYIQTFFGVSLQKEHFEVIDMHV